MSMTKTDKQALRDNATDATGGSWVRESGEGWEAICCDDDQGNAGFIIAEFQGKDAAANRAFVQSANPQVVLALLDELEAKDIVRSAQDYQFDKQADRIAELENELGHANARNDAKCAQLCKQDEEIGTLRHRISELEARDKPKFVQCWSCKHDVEISAIADCDGYCPRCAAPIDLDDEPYAGIALDTGE